MTTSKTNHEPTDCRATITLSVWLGEGNPDLLEPDWAHLQTEVRAANATLNDGPTPDNADQFDVDGASIRFTVV